MAQLIHVKDVSTATGLEVTAGGKVCVCMLLIGAMFVVNFSLMLELFIVSYSGVSLSFCAGGL